MSGRTTARLLTRLAQAATRLDPAIVGPLLLLGIVLGMIVILRGQKDHELVAQVTAGNLKLPEFYTAQNAITATAAQAAAGAAVLVGVFFTLRNLRISQESQVTSRYIQAVTQLGSDKLAVRLGGIYALERVAWDSERDHQTVMDVLTAYVRELAPWPPPDQSAPRESLPADIQVILTVLGRRRPRHRQRESHPLVLPTTDLRSADLRGAHLEGAILWRANLERANLWRANLERADLGRANLERANLEVAHLEGVGLGEAHLEGADLSDAHPGGGEPGEGTPRGGVLGGGTLGEGIPRVGEPDGS
jgi:hypothetical protein